MQAVQKQGWMMRDDLKSGCPINLALEVLGDRWSLLIIRDMMFGDRRHYRELLSKSEERISSNILAERLKMLAERGIVTKVDDPAHKQKAIYSLTEQGITLLPILAQMGAWGVRFLPVSEELGVRAQLLADGGADMWNAFMDELRERHLGRSAHVKKKAALSVSGQLQRALEIAQARPHKRLMKVRGFDKSRPRAR